MGDGPNGTVRRGRGVKLRLSPKVKSSPAEARHQNKIKEDVIRFCRG